MTLKREFLDINHADSSFYQSVLMVHKVPICHFFFILLLKTNLVILEIAVGSTKKHFQENILLKKTNQKCEQKEKSFQSLVP